MGKEGRGGWARPSNPHCTKLPHRISTLTWTWTLTLTVDRAVNQGVQVQVQVQRGVLAATEGCGQCVLWVPWWVGVSAAPGLGAIRFGMLAGASPSLSVAPEPWPAEPLMMVLGGGGGGGAH